MEKFKNNIKGITLVTLVTLVVTTTGYTVHPVFTNESSIGYANGGWNQELTGIWVAKFEAGYATSNGNSAPKKESSVNYSQDTVFASSLETSTGKDGELSARNWIDGVYGSTKTSIKYPTFQGLTYSMNYINHNDAYRISKVLTESGNIYGLNNSSTDSHLMKNSEWGAVSYLSQSKYGLDGTNIVINSVYLNNTTKSVYAVTGCASSTADASAVSTTIGALNNRTQSGVYVWTQKNGTAASSTGTIYGIYDMSGGTWERTASIVNNGNSNLTTYGSQIMADLNNGGSTKYITVYPHDSSKDNTSISNTDANFNTANQANYVKNTKIYGDGIRETSTAGTGKSSWYSDYSCFAGLSYPLFERGGGYGNTSGAGLFSFYRDNGGSYYTYGFRSVLVSL